MLCCTALYCTVLYCTVLYCTVLYCTVLYCTVLYCTVLYCIVLYVTEIIELTSGSGMYGLMTFAHHIAPSTSPTSRDTLLHECAHTCRRIAIGWRCKINKSYTSGIGVVGAVEKSAVVKYDEVELKYDEVELSGVKPQHSTSLIIGLKMGGFST